MKINIVDNELMRCEQEKDFEDIEILDDIKYVNTNALRKLSLNKVTIHNSEFSANSECIDDCTINELDINIKIKNITYDIIKRCDIKKVYINNTVIPSGLFKICNIEELILGDNVRIIDNNAFKECKINKITFNDSLSVIGIGAFIECRFNNQNIELPKSLIYVGDYAFSDCYEYSVSAPSDIKNLCKGNSAFGFHDKNLISANFKNILLPAIIIDNIYYKYLDGPLDIPEGIEEIGESAFSKYSSDSEISEINLPSTLKTIGAFAFQGVKVDKIKFPNSLKYIGLSAFENCGLTNVDLNQVETISAYAFAENQKLYTIKLPKTLKKIEVFAFEDCYNLKQIEIPAINDLEISGAISLVSEIIVPENVYLYNKNKNKNKPNYKDFKEISNYTIKEISLNDLLEAGYSISEINNCYKKIKENSQEK